MKSIKGLAYATLLPGSAAITATLVDGGVVATASAELCVDCWEYTHIRQNVGGWAQELYAMNDDGTPRGTYGYNKDGGRDWTGVYLGKEFSISNKGCHMVSAAMVLTATTGGFVDPADLNKFLQTNDGYDGDNGPMWSIIQSWPDINAPNSGIDSVVLWNAKTTAGQALQDCDMVVAATGPCKYHPNNHFILIVKKVGGKYKVYDPWIIRNDQGEITENLVQLDDLDDLTRGLQFDYFIKIKTKKL